MDTLYLWEISAFGRLECPSLEIGSRGKQGMWESTEREYVSEKQGKKGKEEGGAEKVLES